jgi:hypothetical protein
MTKLLATSAFLLAALANVLPCCAQLNPPAFSPPAGTYSRPFTLAMTADSGTTIYYTTDGSAPSGGSNVYSGPITISAGTTTVQAIAISGAFLTHYIAPSPVTSATYTVAPPASATQLKSSASTLILPGSLGLTATVNPTASGAAVPSGNVTFYSNTSNQLGTAPLQIIPSSQAWTDEGVLGTPISSPAGLASVVLAKGAQPVLVSAQDVGPNVGLYKLSPGGNALNAYTYTNPNMTTTDAVVAGYFLQPASSSVQSFLVHWYGEYDVFDGSTAASGTGLSLNAPTKTSSSFYCDCPQPDNETLSVADFDNDGYDDLGVFTAPYSYYDYYGNLYYYDGVAGVAINSGSSAAGAFESFVGITPPPDLTHPTVFCPAAITTGHFMSSGGAQLAVLASTPQTSCTNSGPFAVYLFAYDAKNITLNEIGTPLALPDNTATTLAAADLNNDGISDLIIGEYIPGTAVLGAIKAAAAVPSGGILTALGTGDGTFKALSALSAVPAAPIAFTVNDFNADGNMDVAYTSVNGYSILTGDGTGNFSGRKDYTTAVSSAPGGIASGDFNSDGLADLAIAPGSDAINNSNVDIELNSASAKAVLPLGTHALAAGSYSLTAVFPGDPNFATSTSPAVPVTVSQTAPTITWTGSGGTLKYGTSLSGAQLNAAATVPGAFTYTPGLGAILPPGTNVVKVAFAPTDSFNYAPASATLSITVGSPVLSSITPTSANVGSNDTTITATGMGFVNGAVVTFNGNLLATTFVDLNHLTAVIPASQLKSPALATIAVADPGGLAVTGSATFSITVGTPTLAGIAPTSVNAGSSDTTITVTGGGFVNGAAVTFNGTALATTFVDLNHLTAVIPAKLLVAPASAKVGVVNPGKLAGTGSATFSITVGTPALASIAPTSVNVGNTDVSITVTGMGFVNGAVATFNGTALATTYVDLQHLTAVIPAKLLVAPASAKVGVVNPGNLAGTGSANFSITVGTPSLASIAPTSANVGNTDVSIAVTGMGFVNGAVATFNGTALATAYVDLQHLTAVIPAKLLVAPASATIAVFNPGNLAGTGSATFSIKAPSAAATVTASETTITAGQQSTITLAVDPYPVPVTATATLTFTPAPPNTVQDPVVLFSDNETTETATIDPASTTSSNDFAFQAGSTAGTMTFTIHLTLDNGQDVTPSNIEPVTVTVPASPPDIKSATLTRSGQSLQIAVIGLSSTRDMSEANFHFTPVSGKSLATSDVRVQLKSAFQIYYSSPDSDGHGTNFTYTQPFTLDGDATDIQSVSITLVNSAGTSEAATAQ